MWQRHARHDSKGRGGRQRHHRKDEVRWTGAIPVSESECAIAVPSPWPGKGALLGIDYGTVRVGLAVTDPDRIIASPLDTYARRSEPLDGAYFQKVVTDHRVVGLVVGLPLHANGQESVSSAGARTFGKWLTTITGLRTVFWDERYSTWFAEGALLGAKLTHKKRKEKRDRVAAQMILQAYIEAGCPPQGTQTAPPDENPPDSSR
ncbi:MAG: Holliday junction resolvase RuvX [Planctomycetaceae bacterium]|nr:Holliday junction resolvase RuvX [Planctomycetaceae bacterium]